MRDGGFNCRSTEVGSVCFTKHISSASACKCGEEVDALVLTEVRQPFILDSMSAKESSPPIKTPNLLLVVGGSKAGCSVNERLRDDSQQFISFGTGNTLKFCGVCDGNRNLKA